MNFPAHSPDAPDAGNSEPRADPLGAGDPLNEHGTFLRRLAKSLVRDEQRAEDIVQEAYVAVLQRPPPDRAPLRAWMAGIVKNLARKSHRSERRRRTREQLAGEQGVVTQSQDEQASPPDDITVRLELQQRLTEAVRLLEEPMRTTVVQRFYDGRTPTEIAALESVSVRTIESRLRRAREKLRHVLDRASGGDRGRWMLAFAPMAFEPDVLAALFASAATPTTASLGSGAATASGAPALSVATTMAVLCVAGAAVAGYWLALPAAQPTNATDTRTEQASVPADGRRVDPIDAGLEAELRRARTERARLESLRAAKRSQPERASAAPTITTAYREATQQPRFRPDQGGAPLEGADWTASGQALVHLNASLAAMASEASASSGADITPYVAGVQRWNAPLLALETHLSAERKAKARGVPNQWFTAPYPQANLIYAALLYAKDPLTKAQEDSLGKLAARHERQEDIALSGLRKDTIRLRRLLVLTAARQAFFDAVVPMLTPTQRDILQPSAVRGRVGFDLLSDGAIWQMQAQTVVHKDDNDLETYVVLDLQHRLGLKSEAERAVLADEVRRWVVDDLGAIRLLGQDGLDEIDVHHVARLRRAATASAALFERLIERLAGNLPAVKALRTGSKALLPIRRTTGR